ncbi:MAG: hypothetical protein KAV87_68655 [Desulfobacteraceae bacterium]|nr:hypothetical protein [Desulfobacteraceae bacterium]
MRAKMKKNLVALYEKYLPGEIEAQGDAEGKKTIAFLESIEGRCVDLIFTAGDAFEKEDNDYWLPDGLWDEI